MLPARPLNDGQLRAIRLIAAECRRQQSGEESVARMVEAWNWALMAQAHGSTRFSLDDLLHVAAVIEPEKASGFRRVGVRVGYDIKGPWQVHRQMDALMGALDDLTPDEWFRAFEEVHPFRDGNGRTGWVLWNWLRDSLAEPDDPPDFWGRSDLDYLERELPRYPRRPQA